MTPEQLVYLGIFINAIGNIGYIRGTLRGKIKPDKVSFLIWSIAPLVAFFAQTSKGVGVQSLMTLSVGLFPLCVFIASFVNKKAFWKLDLRDILCGVIAFVGIILWYLTKDASLAILFSVLAEGVATLPTIIKSYYYPKTESGWPWLASTIGGILTLLSIHTWEFATIAFPFFYTIEMIIIFLLVQFKLGKK